MTSRARQSQTLSELNELIDKIWTTNVVKDFQQLVVKDDFTPPDNLKDKVEFIVWGFGHLFVNLAKLSAEFHDQTEEITKLKEEVNRNKELTKENKELKEEILHKSQSGTAIDSEVVEELVQIRARYSLMLDKYKLMSEEIAQLKEN